MDALEFNEYEKLALSTMTSKELDEYNNLSLDDKETYLGGFKDCIDEYVNVKAGNTTSENNDMPGQSDGLDHWVSKQLQQEIEKQLLGQASKSNNVDDDNSIQNSKKQAKDAGDDAQDAGDDAQDAGDDAKRKSDKESAQKAADKALKAADKAQQAADKAQAAADAAKQKASQTGDKLDLDAANKAQHAADKAQQAADEAREAADRALGAADKAKNSNSPEEEADAANDAGEAAQQAGEAANEAGQSAKNAADEASGSNGDNSSDNNSIKEPGGMMDEQDMDFEEIDLDGDLNKEGLNIDNDLFPDDMDPQEFMKKLAEEAGQDLDADDYVDPMEHQTEIYSRISSELKNKKSSGRGFGNSLLSLTDKIAELFKSTLNWKAALKALFNSVAKHGSEDVMAKRRMGVDASHPLHKGRYLHPNEIKTDVIDGLTLVFFLIDNSGSMGFDSGEGQIYLKHLFSEIFDLERRTNILNSAIAYFGAGPIPKKNIRTWTGKEVRNKTKLLEKIVRHAGDLGGGTSLATGLNSIMEIGKPYYSKKKPATLLIIVSDGYDSFKFIDKELNADLKNRCIFIILNTGKMLDETKKILVEQGIKSNHVLLADTKEWR